MCECVWKGLIILCVCVCKGQVIYVCVCMCVHVNKREKGFMCVLTFCRRAFMCLFIFM